MGGTARPSLADAYEVRDPKAHPMSLDAEALSSSHLMTVPQACEAGRIRPLVP